MSNNQVVELSNKLNNLQTKLNDIVLRVVTEQPGFFMQLDHWITENMNDLKKLALPGGILWSLGEQATADSDEAS